MKPQGLFILFAFVIVNILGFSSLAHASHAMHHSCLFEFSSNCAQVVNPINSTLEHLSNLQASLRASLGQTNILTLLLLAFSLIAGVFVAAKVRPKVTYYFQKSSVQLSGDIFKLKNRFLAWLSILNKRDPLALQTVR
ncbi:MAG: hypothetical protein HY093_02590 [Candidatus Liptonbacteria bacterium]|nr:hypothetical protein [Candidatus Liptonbacteria bacterium]